MKKEMMETGKNVDAAIDSACEKLGCSRDDCEWEIIDLPKKGFLGIKNIPAKVRVLVEVPDEKPPVQAQRPEPRHTEPRPRQPERQAQPRPRPEPPARERQPVAQRNDAQPEAARPESLKTEELSEKEVLARDFINAVIKEMGLTAEYAVTHEHGGTSINIVGKGLGAIIGRRGETLDAIQYLAGLAANRGDGEYIRLTVDCGDYRLKRRDTLEALAKKLAHQVLKTNVSKTLEPMNPFERRIIHATVSEIEGVSSASIGEEPNRRVVITSPTARPAAKSSFRPAGGNRPSGDRDFRDTRGPKPRYPRDGGEVKEPTADGGGYRGNRDNRNDRGGDRNDRVDRGDRDRRGGSGGGIRSARPAASPVPQGPPKQTPETEATQGISFGKIEL